MQLTLFASETDNRPASSSGKTCRACSIPKTTPSAVFWADWPEKTYRLSRQGKNGRTRVLCLAQTREIAWRVLDAQFFGVPQRRRRIFAVASARAIRPAEILFERQGQAGDFGAGAETREDPAAFIEGSSGTYRQSAGGGTVKASGGALQGGSETLIVVHGRQDPCTSDKAFTLDCQHSGNTNIVCINGNIIGKDPNGTSGGNGMGAIQDGTAYTLTATDRHAVSDGLQVRRLTPTECERLQGFPSGHTQIPWRGKPAADCPDSLRYKAIGNSMAVPVMRWIGWEIKQETRGK